MIQAMFSGVSGLKAFKTQLDVIGNNVANVNTTGFKSSRVTFRDMLSQTLRPASGPSGLTGGSNAVQVGLGVGIGSIDMNDTQGSLQATGKLTDAAIEGNGFFVLSTGSGMAFTRDGSFGLDSQYKLVSSTGMPVLGWQADPITGAIDTNQQVTAASQITIPIGQLSSARQTSIVDFGGNLDAAAEIGHVESKTMPVYDSLGISHLVNVTFTKTNQPSQWSYSIDSTETTPSNLATGNIQFDANGKSDTDLVDVSMALTAPNGSQTPLDMQVSFGNVGQLQGKYTVGPTYQDGLAQGNLDSFTIGKDGTVSGTFTNGSIRPLARIALAEFSNSAGLMRAGSNVMTTSPNSGIPQIGPADSGSRGKISAGFLESSNVDLSNEFANMIIAQRGFQANSRIITTSDEVLQELVQLKR